MRTRSKMSWKAIVPIVLLALLASTLAASAGQDITVKVPFNFSAGKTAFPPGAYVFSLDRATHGSVVIKSTEQGKSAILFAEKAVGASEATPTVAFRSYGDSRFIAEIRTGTGECWKLAPSAEETSLARRTGTPAAVATYKAEPAESK